jgi:hypothetical protein
VRAKAWADAHAGSAFSQFGEDGILEAIFGALGVEDGFCVEFGAWDGIRCSNTHNLVLRGWSAFLIEADPEDYRLLVERMRAFPEVMCRQALVSPAGENTLDSLLAEASAPREPDLVSIDVDGLDYHLWSSVRAFSPKVVVIEYNPTIPNDVEFVQEQDARVARGSSIRSLAGLAAEKGYELTAVTEVNGIFVRGDLFPLLGLEENSLPALRDDSDTKTVLFQGFDGTLILAGNKRLLWHGLPIDESRIQVLPRILRTYPGRLSPRMQALRHAWSLLYLARSGQLDRHSEDLAHHECSLRELIWRGRKRMAASVRSIGARTLR